MSIQTTTDALLKLQRMEMALVRAWLAHPDLMSMPDYQRLRYALGFARLRPFAPGAALKTRARADVTPDEAVIAPFRERVMQLLYRPLYKEEVLRERLTRSLAVLPQLQQALTPARSQLLARHADVFSAEELDAEAGRRALVTIAGGGGGAGYVYIGAAARLRAEGMASDYLVGASIGALIGAFLTRSRQLDIESLMGWAKSLRVKDIFSRPYVGATHTLPGLMRLHLHAMHRALVHPDGTPLRLSDLEIPYEAVIAGVRRRVYDHLPGMLRQMAEPSGRRRGSFSRQLAERMLMIGTFANPGVVQPIVLGRDASTRDLRVADAVGLSAAIPAVLQYEPPKRDERSDAVLAQLRKAHDAVLFVDGGVTANVPARIAWEGVEAGRIGTRNAFYLALDCFHPQLDPRHLWLWPVTQIVQLQLNSQRPYFDWLMRFEPTLSPLNLLPSASDFDRAFQWGWNQADVMMPFLKQALAPVRFEP